MILILLIIINNNAEPTYVKSAYRYTAWIYDIMTDVIIHFSFNI